MRIESHACHRPYDLHVIEWVRKSTKIANVRGSDRMKAVIITRPGDPEVLAIQDVPTPEPVGDQVRIRVRAAGLNRADLAQRMGFYPAPPGVPSNIPGLE